MPASGSTVVEPVPQDISVTHASSSLMHLSATFRACPNVLSIWLAKPVSLARVVPGRGTLCPLLFGVQEGRLGCVGDVEAVGRIEH